MGQLESEAWINLTSAPTGHHTVRKRKWTAEQQKALRALAQADGGSANSLLRTLAQTEGLPAISQETARRYLHETQFSYKL